MGGAGSPHIPPTQSASCMRKRTHARTEKYFLPREPRQKMIEIAIFSNLEVIKYV